MIDDSAVGIFFGIDNTRRSTSNFLVLDVRNVSQLSFMDRYPISSDSSQLSKTAIIGISVGVSCVSFILFFFKKKRGFDLTHVDIGCIEYPSRYRLLC